MKIVRSSKCTTKFMTKAKKQLLRIVLKEYGRMVNLFIDQFWVNPIQKYELLKPIVDIPKTWLSYTLRAVAAREAIDMICGVKEVFKWNKQQLQNRIYLLESRIDDTKSDTKQNRRRINDWHKQLKVRKMKLSVLQPHKPKHKGKSMSITENIVLFQEPKNTKEFDAWLHLQSLGNKMILNIPVKFHNQFNRLNEIGKRCNYYTITEDYVQFAFKIETGPKKEVQRLIGVDTGINALASTSDGKQYGKDIKACIARVKRCKYGSNGQKTARRALKQRIDEVAKETVKDADLVVVEDLKGIGTNTKLKGSLNKEMRYTIGNWNQAYWMMRVEQQCELNRVSFRRVTSYYTSQTCPICGCVNRLNRQGELFWCQACNHTGNADLVAAQNIKRRFLTGPYGARYQSLVT